MKNEEKISLIKIINESLEWEKAINKGVELLVNNDIATYELADSIIENTKKLGPYYVLAPRVALAHTQYGSYNKKIGLSLILFKNPIKFSEEKRHEVNLLFTLSAIDGNSHMDILQKFANLLSDSKIVDQAINCNKETELLEIFKELL